MAIIKVIHTLTDPTQSTTAPESSMLDYCITDLHDDKPWKRTVAELLIKLGQKLLQKDIGLEQLSMSRIAAYCRRYKLRWSGSTRARDLELAIGDYILKSADIRGSGVIVEYQTQWSQEKRREVMFLRFRKLNADGICT
jgi:hypothetical protein